MENKKALSDLISAAKVTYTDNEVLQKLVVTQAILESGFLRANGPSGLAKNYNNLFGIKATKMSQRQVKLPTWEHINGKNVKVMAPFQVFADYADCFWRHKDILSLKRYKPVLAAKTIEEACKQIQVCGWATDPSYTKKLIDIYNKHVKSSFDK